VDMNNLLSASVGVADLGQIEVFRRLRRARVVVGMDASSGRLTPVRGAAVWADIAAGRGVEFDADTVLAVRTDGEAEHLFLLVAETLSRC
jgi:hypothetical protein